MTTIDTQDIKEIVKNFKKSPILKAIATGAVILMLIFISGKIMQIIAGAITEFKGLQTAILS